MELTTANLRKLCRICQQQGELNIKDHKITVPAAGLRVVSNWKRISTDEDIQTPEGSCSSGDISAGLDEEVTVTEMLQHFDKIECTELQLLCESCLKELISCYVFHKKLKAANRSLKRLYKEALVLEHVINESVEMLEEEAEDDEEEQEVEEQECDTMLELNQVGMQLQAKNSSKTSIAKKSMQILNTHATPATDGEESQEFLYSCILPQTTTTTTTTTGNTKQNAYTKSHTIRNPKFILTGGVSQMLTHFNTETSTETSTKRTSMRTTYAQKRARTQKTGRSSKNERLAVQRASLVVTKFVPSEPCLGMPFENSNKQDQDMADAQIAAIATTANDVRTMDYMAVEIKASHLQQIAEEEDEMEAVPALSSASTTLSTPVYACKYCPQVYAMPQYLITHVRKTHVCKFCTQAFVKMPDLHAHIREAHQQHVCVICSKQFSSHSNMRGHLKRMHGLNLPSQMALLEYRPPPIAEEELEEEGEEDEVPIAEDNDSDVMAEDTASVSADSLTADDQSNEGQKYTICIEYA